MQNKVFLLILLPFLAFASCNQKTSDNKDTIMVNDFENLDQLALLKFPFPRHADRGRIDLVSEHATHGEKALKYYNEYGSSIEMGHYFTNIAGGEIDISNMKSMEIDVFNASDFDTSCAVTFYATEDMDAILTESFSLKKDEMTHISFELSKIALEYNYRNIYCATLRLLTPNTDYDRGIGYTFFVDNWHVKMGSEYTEEDLLYKPIIDSIVSKINNLPMRFDVQLSDDTILLEIARLVDQLPNMYRGVLPNLSDYREIVDAYNTLVNTDRVIDYDENAFLDLDKFYGISQLQADNGVKADVMYSEDEWEGNEFDGSIKVSFLGSINNRLLYKSPVDLNDFDYVSLKAHNASGNYVRIWISYENNLFMEIPQGETVEATFPASVVARQLYWSVDHLSSRYGQMLPASGNVYFGYAYVTGRSERTLQAQMRHAFDTLKDPSSLSNEESYLLSLTSADTARYLYNTVDDQSTVSASELAKLSELETKIDNAGYGVAYNAYDGGMMRFDTYGYDFVGKAGIFDDDFGFVAEANINVNPEHPTIPGTHEQAFTFVGELNLDDKYNGYTIYVYNPTDYDLYLVARRTDWNWEKVVDKTLARNWNKIDISKEMLHECQQHKVAFFVTDGGRDLDLRGTWRFSSLFGIPRSVA